MCHAGRRSLFRFAIRRCCALTCSAAHAAQRQRPGFVGCPHRQIPSAFRFRSQRASLDGAICRLQWGQFMRLSRASRKTSDSLLSPACNCHSMRGNYTEYTPPDPRAPRRTSRCRDTLRIRAPPSASSPACCGLARPLPPPHVRATAPPMERTSHQFGSTPRPQPQSPTPADPPTLPDRPGSSPRRSAAGTPRPTWRTKCPPPDLLLHALYRAQRRCCHGAQGLRRRRAFVGPPEASQVGRGERAEPGPRRPVV